MARAMTVWTLGALVAWATAALSAPPARAAVIQKTQKVAPSKKAPIKKKARKTASVEPSDEGGETAGGEGGEEGGQAARDEGPPSEEDIQREVERRTRQETQRIQRQYQQQMGQYGPSGAGQEGEGGDASGGEGGQGERDGEGESGERGGRERQDAPEPPPAPEKPRGPMSMTDAKVNAPTVIEAYVALNSEDGVLPYREEGGKSWKLKLQRVREGTLRRLSPDHFIACADMTSMGADRTALDVDFTLDFSGPRWSVEAMDIHKAAGEARFDYDDENRRVKKSKAPAGAASAPPGAGSTPAQPAKPKKKPE